MPTVDWEDPFCETGKNKAIPDLWVPGRQVPPVSLKAIRERQKPLLPYLQEWADAADEALKRIQGSPGGGLLVSSLRTQVQVQVFYRLPDHPDVLDLFPSLFLTCSPVTFPASRKPGISVFDYLLPTQQVADFQPADAAASINPDKRKAILAAEMELGLVRRVALSSRAEMPKERVVVYPELLRFVGHWIQNIESPISGLRFGEVVRESNIRAASPNERSARTSSVPAKPQLQ